LSETMRETYAHIKIDNEFYSDILRVNSLDKNDLTILADHLDSNLNLLSYNLYKDNFSRYFSLYLDPKSDLLTLPIAIFLVLVNNKLKRFDKCAYYLEEYLEKNVGKSVSLENMEYYKCASYFFKQRSMSDNFDEILNNLSPIFGEALSKEVISDLKNPVDSFQYYKLPNCGDCSKCDITSECRYEEWKKHTTILTNKASKNMPDQKYLVNIFKDII